MGDLMKKRREKMDANEIERKLEEKKAYMKGVFNYLYDI